MTDEIPKRTTLGFSDFDPVEEFRERKPEDMTNGQYLAFLLDKREFDPDLASAVADAVEDRVRDELSLDYGPVRDAARTGAKQAMSEER